MDFPDADAPDLDALVRAHTEPGRAPLVPELALGLLRPESPLWRSFGDDPDAGEVHRPYWAFAWAGGQALARLVLDRPALVAGRRVLDFGAGCGVTAVAAARAGAAAVLASDIDPRAGAATRANAAANGFAVDVTSEDLIYAENRGWDVVLAGDLWYDSRLARHGLRWLRGLAGEGVDVLAADPGRAFTPSAGVEEVVRYRARSVPDLEHPDVRAVSVYRIAAASEE